MFSSCLCSDLEQYVSSLQRDATSTQRTVTLKDVEDGALTLRKVGESLAGLKGGFEPWTQSDSGNSAGGWGGICGGCPLTECVCVCVCSIRGVPSPADQDEGSSEGGGGGREVPEGGAS